ncbi:outer membrane protein assembly factor BamE [Neisseria sp. Ec49-e6-T10]|uniref:outer membrane protein assembly factor BamE n=1 Tax=Neisseria sp. Ec49-e6-T10 TaxID=3140744 RepID=UPI003EB91C55
MKKLIFIIICTLTLAACNSHRVSQFPSYKLTIEQGNELDPQALSQLQAGLTRNQVRALLGSPLLTDIFHANRWDYVFMITRNGVTKEQRNLTIFFDNDMVNRFEGDALRELAKESKQDQQTENEQAQKEAVEDEHNK